jgi:aspartate dehydrogenase
MAAQMGWRGTLESWTEMTSDELSSQHREAREPLYTTDVHAFLAQDITLVVEAASQAVCREIAPQVLVLVAGKDLMPMSVGAFADESFLQQMRDLAREHGRCVYLPSGAIGGLDALSAGAIDELDEVVLTTTKPPHALERASMEQDVDLTTITEPTCIYDGPAIEAVRLFPKNVNVAAALSLAGAGVERTRVRIVADPEATGNSHRVEARGRLGAFTIELHLHPSPDNPRTSYLAVLSAIRTLKNLSEPIRFGG